MNGNQAGKTDLQARIVTVGPVTLTLPERSRQTFTIIATNPDHPILVQAPDGRILARLRRGAAAVVRPGRCGVWGRTPGPARTRRTRNTVSRKEPK